jgi:putative membrane-bound dehydrogenase-like protein
MKTLFLTSLLCLATATGFSADPAKAAARNAAPLFKSGIIAKGFVEIDVDISKATSLWLVVTPGDDGFGCDWADWAEPRLIGPKGETKLTDLKWRSATSGFGESRINASAGGQPLKIGGQSIPYGIGTHAPSVIAYDIVGLGFTRFKAKAGLDNGGTDQGCGSTVEFLVFGDRPPAAYQNMARDGAAMAAKERGSGPAAAAEDTGRLLTPPGLEATLFASEPDIVNPTDLDIDAQGRVWVTEGANYRVSPHMNKQWGVQRKDGDRIVILEDTNGDGKSDKSKIFYQDPSINAALGICVLGNKVIVSASPYAFVLTDTNGDDVADTREVLFHDGSRGDHDHAMHAFIFGPDGKLYFNCGNEFQRLSRPKGTATVPLKGPITNLELEPVTDKAGNLVNNSRRPYQEGLIFRCNLDGSELETLAWNFRNNYETAIDSFGTLWQSDNDDDGNKGVRINYVMEFGNYGYRHELTGAGWRTKRTNMEKEVPAQHWYQNDPGVVPNLIFTGSGSPTGITLYEGTLLPKEFQGQMIHCDAGPRTVRAYPVQNDGAGYRGTMVDILTSTDSWYRPADVATAPDGSLYIADWNDAGVGGHNMADRELAKMRGRIYRVAPPGHKPNVPKLNLDTAAGAVAALQSPNLATRYLAWEKLRALGAQAEADLAKVWRGTDPGQRARALNVLARIPGKERAYVVEALRDNDANIRITALRIARQLDWPRINEAALNDKKQLKGAATKAAVNTLFNALGGKKQTVGDAVSNLGSELTYDLITAISTLVNDTNPQVRRECALALRGSQSPEAAALWAKLAQQHDGKDRWYLEALGIGADKQWDAFLGAWLTAVGNNWNTPAGRDLIWRSRATQTPGLLAQLIITRQKEKDEWPRYFRALDYFEGTEKEKALVQVLTTIK